MESFFEKSPRKLFIKDLKSFPSIPVWINGRIVKVNSTDNLIINDGTGEAKISKCDATNTHGDKSWITIGSNCCVIGLLLPPKEQPEIIARKLINISDKEINNKLWSLEVQELKWFLEGKILPDVFKDDF